MTAGTADRIRLAYEHVNRAEADELRGFVADDAYWQPDAHTPRRPAEGGDDVAQRLAWRGAVHRLRVINVVAFGDRAILTLLGRRMHYLGTRFWDRRLYQVVTLRDGKILRIEDYRNQKDAFAAAGVRVDT